MGVVPALIRFSFFDFPTVDDLTAEVLVEDLGAGVFMDFKAGVLVDLKAGVLLATEGRTLECPVAARVALKGILLSVTIFTVEFLPGALFLVSGTGGKAAKLSTGW